MKEGKINSRMELNPLYINNIFYSISLRKPENEEDSQTPAKEEQEKC